MFNRTVSLVLYLLAITLLPSVLLAEELVHYKIYNDNSSFRISSQERESSTMLIDIATKTMRGPFHPDKIADKYYDVTITDGVLWEGATVRQYEYTPKNKDRFKQNLWVKDNKSIVKREIVDGYGSILFSAVCFEDCPESVHPWVSQSDTLAGTPDIYEGFVNLRKQDAEDGKCRFLLTDGLNSFSVFVSRSSQMEDTVAEKVIVYGNYVYSKNHFKYRYTVVGTVPFETMEKVVMLISTDQVKLGNRCK